MPLIQVKAIEEVFTQEKKQEIVKKLPIRWSVSKAKSETVHAGLVRGDLERIMGRRWKYADNRRRQGPSRQKPTCGGTGGSGKGEVPRYIGIFVEAMATSISITNSSAIGRVSRPRINSVSGAGAGTFTAEACRPLEPGDLNGLSGITKSAPGLS
jgi:hypothetical protein